MFTTIRNLIIRTQNRHILELVKFAELETLGRFASTYCYHHPSHVQIELTTRCNLRCQWCNQSNAAWQEKFGNRDMPFELFEKIIHQLKGSRVVLLYNIGEPLLYKNLFKAIRLARNYIPEVRITSNTTMLTEEKARQLEEAGLTCLNVSIDSPRPELMKKIRGVDLGQVEEKLTMFGRTCSIPIETWTVISQANVEDLKGLPDWASRFPAIKGLYFQLQNGVEQGHRIGLPALNSKEQFKELQEIVGGRCESLGLKTNIRSLPYYSEGFHHKAAHGICKAPFTQLVAINVEGHLAPCCSYATICLGDVGKEGFRNVWNGPRMRAWRKNMLTQHYCAYCSEWCGFKGVQV